MKVLYRHIHIWQHEKDSISHIILNITSLTKNNVSIPISATIKFVHQVRSHRVLSPSNHIVSRMQQPSLLEDKDPASLGFNIHPLLRIQIGMERCCPAKKEIPRHVLLQLFCNRVSSFLGGILSKNLGGVIQVEM